MTTDTGDLLIAHAYAVEALAAIRQIALDALPGTGQQRAVHDPLLDILAATARGLRPTKEETCSIR